MISDWIPNGDKPAIKLKVKPSLNAKDAAFIATIVKLFKPANHLLAEKVRSGCFAIQMHPTTGEAHIIDLQIDAPEPTPDEIISFFAGFTASEWDMLQPHREELLETYRTNRTKAIRFVQEILKFAPAWQDKTFAQG